MTSSMSGYKGFGGFGSMERGGGQGDVIPSGYRKGQLNQFTPQQHTFLEQLLGYFGPESYLGKIAGGDMSQIPGGDEQFFNDIEAPGLRNLQGIQGQLASRFGGQGLGGTHSSAYQNAQGQLGANFVQDMAKYRQEIQFKRQELMQQALRDLTGIGSTLLNQRPFENFVSEKRRSQPSGWGGIGGAALGSIPGLVTMNPALAFGGANVGYNIGSQF